MLSHRESAHLPELPHISASLLSYRSARDSLQIVSLDLSAEMPGGRGKQEDVDGREGVVDRCHHQAVPREDGAGQRQRRVLGE